MVGTVGRRCGVCLGLVGMIMVMYFVVVVDVIDDRCYVLTDTL